MADITYDFTAQSDENPWVEDGWSKPTGSIDGRISLGLFTSTSSTNAIYLYNTAPVPVANKISVGIINGNFTGDPSGSRGQAIMSLAGDGYFTLVRSTDLRVYKTTIGGGANTLTQIGSTTTITAADLDNFLFEYDVVTGAINITQGGVSRFTATDTTHIFTGGVLDPAKVAALRLGVCSRAATGRVRSVTAFGVPATATLTLPDDITLLTEYTDNTATGFADGAATLSYGGVNVAVTVASELFDFTLPMIQHDVVSPRLPAVGAEFTLTQGVISATDNANIFLPAGYDTTRVGDLPGGDPANFVGIVDDDPTYLGYAFAQASNDLTTSDSAVFVTSDGYLVGRDTFIQSNEFEIDGITPVLPRTDDLYVWRASTGKYYEHSITLTDASVVVDPSEIIVTGLVNPATGLLSGSYVPIDPDNSWRIASAYRLHKTETLRQVTHLSIRDSAYYKWASTKHEYCSRFAWGGGEPPFRVTLRRSPTTAQLGESGKVQVWGRVEYSPEILIHNYPNHAYEMCWSPTIDDIGQTFAVELFVESQDGQTLTIRRSVTVDDTKFKYFDSVSGSDANPGTFDLPYQTFGYGYSSVVSGQDYVFCYKAGTYAVHNGTPGNSAAFDATHCHSHIGLGATPNDVVMNVDTGSFTKGIDGIYMTNMFVTGGEDGKGNVRQFDLDLRCTNTHFHKVIFDTTVPGTLGNDNPSGVMFWNITSPAYHENIAFTECGLSSTSLCEMAVLFQTKNVIVEGCYSNNPQMLLSNGSMIFHLKDGNLDVTVRHCDFVGDCANGLMWVSSQDWLSCGNIDIQFCRFVNGRTGSGGYVWRWNGQVSASDSLPSNYWAQRCSIDALAAAPFTFEKFTTTGDLVNYTGILWESTAANIAGASTGGQSVGTNSVKVTDINTVALADIGIRGHVIASTMVV